MWNKLWDLLCQIVITVSSIILAFALSSIVYFGMRCLDFTNTFIEYAHEAVLPFYILHYPIIVVLTFLSLLWNIPLGIKFLLVSTLALLATIVVFDLCIRRITIMRWLFGMKLVYEHQQDSRSRPPLHSASS